jgi:hypothetical protein
VRAADHEELALDFHFQFLLPEAGHVRLDLNALLVLDHVEGRPLFVLLEGGEQRLELERAPGALERALQLVLEEVEPALEWFEQLLALAVLA